MDTTRIPKDTQDIETFCVKCHKHHRELIDLWVAKGGGVSSGSTYTWDGVRFEPNASCNGINLGSRCETKLTYPQALAYIKSIGTQAVKKAVKVKEPITAEYFWGGVRYSKDYINGRILHEHADLIKSIEGERDRLSKELAIRRIQRKRHAILAEKRGF